MKDYFKELLRRYIDNEIKSYQTRIINNLLILLKKNITNYKQLLKMFWRKLEIYDICLNEEYLQVLKEESFVWKEIIRSLGISDFSRLELVNYIHGKYDYIIKVRGKSVNESMKKMQYFAKLLGHSLDYFKQSI